MTEQFSSKACYTKRRKVRNWILSHKRSDVSHCCFCFNWTPSPEFCQEPSHGHTRHNYVIRQRVKKIHPRHGHVITYHPQIRWKWAKLVWLYIFLPVSKLILAGKGRPLMIQLSSCFIFIIFHFGWLLFGIHRVCTYKRVLKIIAALIIPHAPTSYKLLEW